MSRGEFLRRATVAGTSLTLAGSLLAAYYFTRDVGRVWRLSEELAYGILGANDGLPATDQTPSGGLKESGFGREGGRYGVEEYLDVKCLSLGGISRKRRA